MNRLLAALPAKDRERLYARGEVVDLVFTQVLANPGEAVRHVYFPAESFISLVTPMGGKATLEIALAGNEGMFGVSVALGAPESNVHALVQGAGSALRIGAVAFRRELAVNPSLTRNVNRYIHVLIGQLAQTAGCNRFHVVEQRLARWMLMTSDRAHSSTFHLTHEFLAFMLGVRRVGITKAARTLQAQKLIAYSRGEVSILDRAGLERASCSCYQTDLDSYARTLG
ncbi:MAG: Crp/Fnr family transcriptional regulator [Usitatibacter sp.]